MSLVVRAIVRLSLRRCWLPRSCSVYVGCTPRLPVGSIRGPRLESSVVRGTSSASDLRSAPMAEHQNSEGEASEQRRVAVVQMTATNDKDKNFEVCSNLAKRAKEAGCVMVFFPECFAFIGARPGEAQGVAETVEGPWLQRYRDLAKTENLWMSLGGFHEYGDGEKIYNAHIVVDDKGEIKAHYRKIHLFDVPMVGLVESTQTMPGSELMAVDSPAGRLGISICYDLRFPELYQKLRFVHGAEIMLAPSAFAVKTGQAHWETLLRCRAIETQCYMLAAAQSGQHNTDGNKRCSYGHAMAVDPWGKVLGDLGGEASESGELMVIDIDPELISSTRANMPMDKHRRYDLYGGPPHAAEDVSSKPASNEDGFFG